MKEQISSCLATTFIVLLALPVQALTCGQFTALGTPANTVEQVVNSPATTRQIEEYKKLIARHVGDVATIFVSSKARALKLATKGNLLTALVRDSLAVTKAFCFSHPSDAMENVAIEKFDYFLDVIAEKNEL